MMAADLEPGDLEVRLLAMRRRHLRSVLRIESKVYPVPWSMSLFLSELALRSTRAYYVATVGRQIVRYAGLMMTLDDGHVTTIAVDPAWHRRGIGTRLLLAAEQGTQLTRATLFTGARSTANLRLYRRLGYVDAHSQSMRSGLELVHLVKELR